MNNQSHFRISGCLLIIGLLLVRVRAKKMMQRWQMRIL
jgi:hypothetical protein